MNLIQKKNNVVLAAIFLILAMSCKSVSQVEIEKEKSPEAPPAATKYGCIEGNCENGNGTFTWENGSKYVGEFKNGAMHGQGTFYFEGSASNKGKYIGEFKNGFIEGFGTWTWENGEKYIGQTKYNKMHGKGTYYYSNGTVKKGIWVNDKFVKEEE